MDNNKDIELKALCKILYDLMGYCSHYEIRLRSKSYITSYKAHDISDIDVYGYKFNSDLSLLTIGAECKSGESNALDEFYKFLGIVDYYNIGVGYLIKSRIHQNAREVAAKNKFRCLSEAEIRKILLGFSIDIDKQQKIELAKYSRLSKNLQSLKKKNEKLYDYITLDYWNRDNWRNIHNLIHLTHIKFNPVLFDDSIAVATDKYLYYYILELFTLSILKAISDAMLLNYSDLENSLSTVLYGGAESLHERRRIADLVSQATGQNSEFEAEWQDDFIVLCSRMSQSTNAASQIPKLIQDLYGNGFYDNQVKLDKSVLKKYPDTTRKFTQDVMQFLNRVCDLEPFIFEDFMTL